MKYYTVITKVRKEISRDEAKLLIVEARYFPDYNDIVAYSSNNNGYLQREYILPAPFDFRWYNDEQLLNYARDNIPDILNIG